MKLLKCAVKHKCLCLGSWSKTCDTHFNAVFKTASSAKFGKSRVIHCVCGDYPFVASKSGSGPRAVINELLINDIHYVLSLVKELPESVFAVGHSFVEDAKKNDVNDTSVLVINFANAVAYLIGRSRSAHGVDHRIDIVGEFGSALFVDNQPVSGVVRRKTKGDNYDRLFDNYDNRYAQSYVNEVENFVDVLAGKNNAKGHDVDEAFRVAAVADAAALSLKTGKVVLIKDNVKNNKQEEGEKKLIVEDDDSVLGKRKREKN